MLCLCLLCKHRPNSRLALDLGQLNIINPAARVKAGQCVPVQMVQLIIHVGHFRVVRIYHFYKNSCVFIRAHEYFRLFRLVNVYLPAYITKIE